MIDFYKTLGEIIREELCKHAIGTAIQVEITRETIENLAAKHGGQAIYLKNLCYERATELHGQIASDYKNGESLAALSQKYQKTQAWLKKIVARCENDITHQ